MTVQIKPWARSGSGLLVVLLTACGGSDYRPAPADVVVTNAKVVTLDANSTVVQALAVRDGKFVAAASTSDISAYIGPNTKVVDAGGRTVIPGLADSHMHTAGGGPGIDLSKTRTLAELLAKVSAAAATAKPGDILVSNSDWHEAQLRELRLPLATELETAAPGIPVVLVRGGHDYILNTTALAKWNITRTTPVPAGGGITRDAQGELTGELVDNAKRLVTLPPTPPTTLDDLVKQQQILNSYGITSVRIPGTTTGAYKQFQQLRDAGQATVRYSILFRYPDLNTFKAAIDAAGIKPTDGDDWVRVWGAKISVDGGFEGGFMTRPYAEPYGMNGTFFGLQTLPQTAFNDYVVGLNRMGWRVATHAVGDAAVDQVLQGYEQANADKDVTQNGWTIEHAFVTRPDQYPRMKKLNLRLSVQDHLYLVAPTLKGYWGIDRASQVTPVKTYMDAGFWLAGGTDSGVIPINPFWVMYHFLTRDTISAGVYGANQAVPSREEVLRMETVNNARLTDEQAVKGSIEVGKLADFVVLGGDIMTVPFKEIESMKALATYIGGKQVYRDPGFNP